MSNQTICLNMIVKDEADIIINTLNNLIEHIDLDYWVICDTGSTDNTAELIETFFKDQTEQEEIFVPFSESKSRSWLYRNNLVIEEKVDSRGSKIFVEWTELQKKKFKADCAYSTSN